MTSVMPWGASHVSPSGQAQASQYAAQTTSTESAKPSESTAPKRIFPVEPTATGKEGEAKELDFQRNLINSFANRVMGIPSPQVSATV